MEITRKEWSVPRERQDNRDKQPSARGGRAREAGRRDHRRGRRCAGHGSAARHVRGAARHAEAGLRRRWNAHWRQLLARYRRCRRSIVDEREAGADRRPPATCLHRSHGLCGHRSERGSAHGTRHHGAASARAGWPSACGIELLEIHEAFAAQVLANAAAWSAVGKALRPARWTGRAST